MDRQPSPERLGLRILKNALGLEVVAVKFANSTISGINDCQAAKKVPHPVLNQVSFFFDNTYVYVSEK